MLAQELGPDGEVVRECDDTPTTSAGSPRRTAKQVILQRLRDAEDEQTFGEYAGKEGDIVTGVVQGRGRAPAGHVLRRHRQGRGRPAAAGAGAGRGVRARQPARCLRRVGGRGHPRAAGDAVRAPTPTWCASCSRWRCPRSPTAASRSRRSPARPGTARRSPSVDGPGSTPRAPASARWGSGCATSWASCTARRSTSSTGPRTRPSSWPRAVARPGAPGRGGRRQANGRAGGRARLPAVAGDRQGGPERPPRRPADRLADRHPQRRRSPTSDAAAPSPRAWAGRRSGPAAPARLDGAARPGRCTARRPDARNIRRPRRASVQGGRSVDPGAHLCGVPGRAPVTDLLRVVATVRGSGPATRRRLPGRGASVHPTPECLRAAERRRAFPRALRLRAPAGGRSAPGPRPQRLLRGRRAQTGWQHQQCPAGPAPGRSSTSTGHRRMTQPMKLSR